MMFFPDGLCGDHAGSRGEAQLFYTQHYKAATASARPTRATLWLAPRQTEKQLTDN